MPSSSFFRALNAPFDFQPSLPEEYHPTVPKVAIPTLPEQLVPLIPNSERHQADDASESVSYLLSHLMSRSSTGPWGWLNAFPLFDIHDTAHLRRDQAHQTTIRMCRAGNRTITFINKLWHADATRSSGFLKELWLYTFPLRDLVGDCVLNLTAVRKCTNNVNLAFEIPHQSFFIEPSADMPQVLKRRVVKALQRLHEKGVCHNDLSLRNILISGDGKVYFHNFSRALCTTELCITGSVQLDTAEHRHFDFEKRRLAFQLDYNNARHRERDRLGNAISILKNNNIERRKRKLDPTYEPNLMARDPSHFMLPKFEAWVQDLDREPRRYVMPGQTEEDYELELKTFYRIIEDMEKRDVAEGFMPQPVDTAIKVEPPTPANEAELIATTVNGSDCRMALDRPLKRKRSNADDSASSEQSSCKRTRQDSQSALDSANLGFKNDELRPDMKLVSSYMIHHSVQENNAVPEWPIVVVRDFQYQDPSPKLDSALKAMIKRNCDRFKQEQEIVRREAAAERRRTAMTRTATPPTTSKSPSTSSSSWISWNPLRYLFGGGHEEIEGGGDESQDLNPVPQRGNRLRRHETLISVSA